MYIIIAKYKISCKFPQLCSTHKIFEKLMRKNEHKLLYNMIYQVLIFYINKKVNEIAVHLCFQRFLFHFSPVTLLLLNDIIVCISIMVHCILVFLNKFIIYDIIILSIFRRKLISIVITIWNSVKQTFHKNRKGYYYYGFEIFR